MLDQSRRFLSHLWTAQTRYAVHSPFVYQFVTQVLPHRRSEAGSQIDQVRKEWGQRREILEIADFGAGYGGDAVPVIHKELREVVKSSARRRRNGELLRRIYAWRQPQQALELGTNLGFSAAYQLAGAPDCRLIGLEGSSVLAQKARDLWQQLGLKAEVRVGEFGNGLGEILAEGNRWDCVLLDGNHRYGPTVDYFQRLVPHMQQGGLIIVDDINWSDEMRRAWREIQDSPAVNVSIDLFWMGLCFIGREQARQHFQFRFWP